MKSVMTSIKTSKNGVPYIEEGTYLIIIRPNYVILKNKVKQNSTTCLTKTQVSQALKECTTLTPYEKELIKFCGKVLQGDYLWADGQYQTKKKQRRKVSH